MYWAETSPQNRGSQFPLILQYFNKHNNSSIKIEYVKVIGEVGFTTGVSRHRKFVVPTLSTGLSGQTVAYSGFYQLITHSRTYSTETDIPNPITNP